MIHKPECPGSIELLSGVWSEVFRSGLSWSFQVQSTTIWLENLLSWVVVSRL